MKKTSLTLAALLVTAISAPTMAADWFVGGGVGAQQNTYEATSTASMGHGDIMNPIYIPGTSDKEDYTDAIYEFRAGAYLNDENRLYGTYSYNTDDGSDQQSLLLSYDYLIHLNDSNSLNLFVGATVGTNHYSPDADDISSSNNFVWGGQTGLMYRITDSLSTEIGYRYLKQDVSDTEQWKESNINYEGTVSLDNSQQVYLAVDYRF
ncbi:porin family protein [Shewanella sp. VB17]|uniref:outer membrane beta-barrel protein n=1 Tax=Shewanella sp. VB17 TaxID=2739432 RepID=UPI0015648635|nr:outer membrane beta-barrel protein [Shewanella sp. VB17]NRD75626.1 porin family protein [Shewanella sp. VB17]